MSKLDELAKMWRKQSEIPFITGHRKFALLECAADLESALAARRECKPSKWHRVEDEMPGGSCVLVRSPIYVIPIAAYYSMQLETWFAFPSRSIVQVTHWRELPKGPEVKP